MKETKETMVRLSPTMVDMIDMLRQEAEADPEMAVEFGDCNGHISRSEMVRQLLHRGAASVRGTLRAKTPRPKPTEPTAQPKPAAKSKKKPAKKRR